MRLIALALFAFLSGCGGSSSSSPSTSIDPSSYAQPAVPATTEPAIVFIGDSIIARWSNLMTLVPDSLNAGIGGQTTAQMLARFDTDVLSHHPKVVVIEGGVNDIVSMEVPTIDNTARMAEKAAASGARVIILSMLPANIPYNVYPFNNELIHLTKGFGYTYVDLFYAMVVPPDNVQDFSLFVDGIHPNEQGYAVMWKVLEPVLKGVETR